MRVETKVRPIPTVSSPTPTRVEELLRLHQDTMSELMAKVLTVPIAEAVKAPTDTPPVSGFDLAALREILTLHQLQLATLIETLCASNDAVAEVQNQRLELTRRRGRVVKMTMEYDEQQRLVAVLPVYQTY